MKNFECLQVAQKVNVGPCYVVGFLKGMLLGELGRERRREGGKRQRLTLDMFDANLFKPIANHVPLHLLMRQTFIKHGRYVIQVARVNSN